MKTVILIFLAGMLFGCEPRQKPVSVAPVITWKRNDTFSGKKLPDGICRFGYAYETSFIEFLDSCHKYHVLDTIVGRKITN